MAKHPLWYEKTVAEEIIPSHQHWAELWKQICPHWLCQNVHLLPLCMNIADLDLTRFNILFKMMIFEGNIFRSRCEPCEVAIAMQDWLSTQTLQKNCGAVINKGNTLFNLSITVINGITLHNTDERVMYSASTVLKAILVCNLLSQYIGQSAYLITKPVCNNRLLASWGSAWSHPPAKSTST